MWPKRKQTCRRNLLRARVGSVPMTGEYADRTESLRPIAGLMIGRLHRPLHSQFNGHVRRCLQFQERGKVPEVIGHTMQLESKAAPECDVVLNGLSQGLYRLPPGQASAMERSDIKSTFA